MRAILGSETRTAVAWPIHDYLEELQLELAPRTVVTYRSVLRDAERRTATPIDSLTRRRLLELSNSWCRRAQNLSILRNFLRWLGSPLAEKVPRGIQPEQKRRLLWYMLPELEEIVRVCESPRQRLLIHLSCELMLRRCEIERLTLTSFEETAIRVLGKGRNGGKIRRIPYHPLTGQLLSAYASSISPSARDGSTSPAHSMAKGRLHFTDIQQMDSPESSQLLRSAIPTSDGWRASEKPSEAQSMGGIVRRPSPSGTGFISGLSSASDPSRKSYSESFLSSRSRENAPFSSQTIAADDPSVSSTDTPMERSKSSRKSSPSTGGETLLGLRRSSLDNELKRIQETLRWEGVNLNLQFHDLRRSGARLFMQAGIAIGKGPLEVLNELRGILGHEDLRTTQLYIGWDLETAGATLAAMPSLESPAEGPAAPAARRGMDRVGCPPTRTRTPPRPRWTPPT